jgi:killing trait domain-containing protein
MADEDVPPPPDDSATDEAPQSKNASEALAEAVRNLSNAYVAVGKDGVSPQVTDAITQALLLILGSGPSVAAFDSLLSVQQANGLMYHNAVANQQKTNLLGMAMTAKCVRYMMDPHSGVDLDVALTGED